MTKTELNKVLREHKKWRDGDGGERADLQRADLQRADLRWADLRWANLQGANLRWADLRWANLQGANLRWANLQGADLPPPTMLLLATWGNVSDKLCLELMRYDASNHPNPMRFDEWANGGDCPYQKGFQRCANFQEVRELWKPGKSKSARELVLMLFKEKDTKYSEGI